MALINHSDKWFYKTADGYVEGDASAPAEAISVLVCPGGSIDEGLAEQVGLADVLGDQAKAKHTNPVTGEELVMRGNRAFAKRAFLPKNPDGSVVERKVVRPIDVAGDSAIENKAVVPGPAAHTTPAKPTPIPAPGKPDKPGDKVADKV